MNVLIIGGTGLISTAITRALLDIGASVTHFNRGKSQTDPPPGVQTLTGDRTDYAAFENAMAEAGTFDCVMDMVGYQPGDAQSVVRALGGKIGQLIFCSTVDVYDQPVGALPIREDAPRAGRNDYGRNKVVIEQALERAAEQGAFPLTILRPAHTYDDQGAILHAFGGGTAWADRLRREKPVIVHGAGGSLWTACHADDVGPAFARAAGNPHAFHKSYNVAGDEWLTWDRMYQICATALGAPPPRLVHIPTDTLTKLAPDRAAIIAQNFRFNNIFDNGAAHHDLGFRYTVSYAEGARRVLGYLQANGKIENSDEQGWYDRLVDAWTRISDAMTVEMAAEASQ
jgi:nucleoside-diphosphate-sugar epimerase